MSVGLVAASDATIVRLVAGMHVTVLLAIRAVGEASVATVELAAERLLTCTMSNQQVCNRLLMRDASNKVFRKLQCV